MVLTDESMSRFTWQIESVTEFGIFIYFSKFHEFSLHYYFNDGSKNLEPSKIVQLFSKNVSIVSRH
jgi:hypothetical protein